ncbi:hypothetical protein WG915_11065 [Corynebacterium sp. H128]|uniref:LLM class flavin-dependent oxidoreductase n=1 Tax=Corynebacterium sp. H128 TaxID=3133427 RepID=UPI0030AB047F
MPIAQADTFAVEFGVANYHVPGHPAPLTHGDATTRRAATLQQAILAEECGLDVFGVNDSFSTTLLELDPFCLIQQVAQRTSRIKLTTSIGDVNSTNLSQRHAEFHQVLELTGKRAEIVLERDNFSPPGADPTADASTSETFNAQLAEWVAMIEQCRADATWIEVVGRSDVILQAASHNIPIMLQISSGNPLKQKHFVDMYHQAISRFGRRDLPLGILVPGLVAASDDVAREASFPSWAHHVGDSIPAEHMSETFSKEIEQGALFIGSPDTVAAKIASTVEHLGLNRFIMRYTCGLHPDSVAEECIRLFGTEVVPRVRELLLQR